MCLCASVSWPEGGLAVAMQQMFTCSTPRFFFYVLFIPVVLVLLTVRLERYTSLTSTCHSLCAIIVLDVYENMCVWGIECVCVWGGGGGDSVNEKGE